MILRNHGIEAAEKAAAEHRQHYIELRNEGLTDEAARAALADFTTYWQASPWPADRAWTYWQTRRIGSTFVTITASTERMTTALRDTHAAFVMLATYLGMKPCSLGLEPCFCHPKPFPPARDYRRRTKHRRRRRQR